MPHNKYINIIVPIITALAAIIALEILLRLFPQLDLQTNNPYQYTRQIGKTTCGIAFSSYHQIYPLHFDNRHYYKKSSGIIEYNFNQFGGRWIEAQEQKLKGEGVIVIGDSLTYGFGLRYTDTYIFKLQGLLNEAAIYLDFINLSRPASDAVTSLEIYNSKKDSIPHTMLIYGLHMNDLIHFPTSYVACDVPKDTSRTIKRSSLMNSASRLLSSLKKRSKLADFAIKRIKNKKDRTEKIRELTNPSAFKTAYFIKNMDAIKKMQAETKERNITFIIVMLPILVDVQETTFDPVYNTIEQTLTESGIKYISLVDCVSGYKDSDLWILPFDQHPNEIAHQLFANRLSSFLKEEYERKYYINRKAKESL